MRIILEDPRVGSGKIDAGFGSKRILMITESGLVDGRLDARGARTLAQHLLSAADIVDRETVKP